MSLGMRKIMSPVVPSCLTAPLICPGDIRSELRDLLYAGLSECYLEREPEVVWVRD